MNDKYDAGALATPGWIESHPGVIPTSAVVLIEAIDGEGQTSFYHLTSDNCPEWRELGLLRAASLQVEGWWGRANQEEES